MHHRNAQKYGLARALVFCTVGIIGFVSGCVLEDLPTVGVQCPPGKEMQAEDGEHYYFVLNNLDCHEGEFVAYTSPYADNSTVDDGKCCEKGEDSNGRQYWKCKMNNECPDSYYLSFDNDIKRCHAYNKQSSFDVNRDNRARYTLMCESEDNCKPAENVTSSFCPPEYDLCHVTDAYEFSCLKHCQRPNIYCEDEYDENRTNICIDPITDIWHCGAKGSCVDDNTDENSAGKVCVGGKICDDGECVCPKHLVECNDKCVDVNKNSDYCGNCDTRCSSDEACINGVCTIVSSVDSCSTVEYQNQDDQCGRDCINCKQIPHQVDPELNAICNGVTGSCQLSKCEPGYHLTDDKKSCELNTVTACGLSETNDPKVHNCIEEMIHGEDVYCGADGICHARKCVNDEKTGDVYTLDDNKQCTSACTLCKAERHEVCSEDKKGCRCDYGYAFCPGEERGVCIDIMTDSNYCGGCDTKCAENEKCDKARCVAKQ